ncbi:MAG: acetylxylan esterase, partial [Fibrobacter sp.]|nr:acetylxylan esterase [Fibrobacter sp.]
LFEKDNYKSYVSRAESWMTSRINNYGGNPYGRLVEMGKQAQEVGVIKGILLHQGETNSGQSNWPSRVKGIYDNLVKDLGLDANTPLVAGEVHPNGACSGMNSIIGQLPNQSKNFYVASAQGITGMLQDGQRVHFDAAGYRTLGKRYAEQMLKALSPISAETSSSSVAPVSNSSSSATSSSSSQVEAQSSSETQTLVATPNADFTDIIGIKVYSPLGQEVAGFNPINKSYAEIMQLCKQKLSAGNYIVQIQGTNFSQNIPLKVNK